MKHKALFFCDDINLSFTVKTSFLCCNVRFSEIKEEIITNYTSIANGFRSIKLSLISYLEDERPPF